MYISIPRLIRVYRSHQYYVYTVIAVDFRCTFYEIKFGPHAQNKTAGIRRRENKNRGRVAVPVDVIVVHRYKIVGTYNIIYLRVWGVGREGLPRKGYCANICAPGRKKKHKYRLVAPRSHHNNIIL